MHDLTKDKEQEILDSFGKVVIEEVRDYSLGIAMGIAKQTTVNPVDLKQYSIFSTLSTEQQEAVCDLLSETVTSTIYNFLEMFEANAEMMKLILLDDGKEYNMMEISEKMGSEIACHEEDGWIQRFSEIGRFVL